MASCCKTATNCTPKRGHMRNSKGFTLVELAIVLIIIGILLGAILKGQELVDNAKIKRAVSDMNSVFVAYNGYIDRYQRKPGDDGPIATLTARGGSWASVTAAGNSNGNLDAAVANTFTNAAVESTSFWQHIKAAGFIPGNITAAGAAALPNNGFNGLVGVFNNTTAIAGAPAGVNVCLSQVPGKAAAALDKQLDDGDPAAGSLRATTGTAGTNTVPGTAATTYVEDSEYTICRAL